MQTLPFPSPVLQLRAAQPEDEPFLFRLFAASQTQLDGLRTQPDLWQTLVAMQYRGRQMTYAARYPMAENFLLLDRDGNSVGRVLLNRQPGCWSIVDIDILCAHRGQGIGTAVLRHWQQQAAQAGVSLALQVNAANPARRLYERCGFKVNAEDLLDATLTWNSQT